MNSVPQTAATTFAFSSVFIRILCRPPIRMQICALCAAQMIFRPMSCLFGITFFGFVSDASFKNFINYLEDKNSPAQVFLLV